MIRFIIPDLSLQGVTLGVFTLMYLLLVILMTRCFLNEVYLIIFSYSKCIISNTLMYSSQVSTVFWSLFSHSSLFLWHRGLNCLGFWSSNGSFRSVVHNVLHLHDLHIIGFAPARMCGGWSTTGNYTIGCWSCPQLPRPKYGQTSESQRGLLKNGFHLT